jgi:uncharacterized protein YbjT (DUF2867 family)
MRTALLAGASGLVGGLCLRRLLAAGEFDQVVVIARRPLELSHERLRVMVTSFDRLAELAPIPAGAALSTLGTTMARAGSEQAFRAVDHDAVLAFAQWARRGGASSFVLLSSVGAATNARSLYLRVKGQVEESVARIDSPAWWCCGRACSSAAVPRAARPRPWLAR